MKRRLKTAHDGSCPGSPLAPEEAPPLQGDILEYYEAKTSTWEGIHILGHIQSQDTHYYGPFSTHFFTQQLSSFLASSTRRPLPDIEPYHDTGAASVPIGGLACLSLEDQISCDFLMKMQQDYLLDLFWSRQHTFYPLIDQSEFLRHYESLWSESSMGVAFRKPSPIVDIVLALCIQFGAALIPSNDDTTGQANPSAVEDTLLAGRMYFQRCHAMLHEEAATTSITAVQCHTYSVLYLLNAGLTNSAHALLATAVQTAHTLGLHHDPPSHLHLSEPHRELRRRLWWSLYILDSTTSMTLGRPSLTHLASATCRLPNDSLHLAQPLGPTYALPPAHADNDDITWLSLHTQTLLLVHAVRTIHAAFLDQQSSSAILSPRTRTRTHSAKSFTTDASASAREKSARFMADCCAKKLSAWARNVPRGLRLRRRDGGPSFSTDSPLDLDLDLDASSSSGTPTWLQRQRLVLELRYHHHAMALHRAFIILGDDSSSAPMSAALAQTALDHAAAITHILHHALVEAPAELLAGVHCVVRYLYGAAVTAVAYACAHPAGSSGSGSGSGGSHPSTTARDTIATAAEVLDRFGATFAPARAAAGVVRELGGRVDEVVLLLSSAVSSNRQTPSAMAEVVTTSSSSSSSSSEESSELGSNQSSHLGSPLLVPELEMGSTAAAAGVGMDNMADLDCLWMSAVGCGGEQGLGGWDDSVGEGGVYWGV